MTFLILFMQCKKKEELKLLAPHRNFMEHITEGNSFYAITKTGDPKQKKDLAIGIFDSGIGGLTVFDAIVNADFYNSANENRPDGINDFEQEQFVYLADLANMPYSLKDFTLIVPFSNELISGEQMDMIQMRLPFTYDLLKNEMNEKMK